MCKDASQNTPWMPPISKGAAMAHGCCGGRSQAQVAPPSAMIIPINIKQGNCAGSCNDSPQTIPEITSDEVA